MALFNKHLTQKVAFWINLTHLIPIKITVCHYETEKENNEKNILVKCLLYKDLHNWHDYCLCIYI